jgi:hypothetical protein
MNAIFIPPESHSPRVEFYPSGKLLLEGRSMPENVFSLFNPLLIFVSELNTERVDFDINLEYFNTSTSKKVLQLLQALDENPRVQERNVVWHYESDDEDSYEMGEIFEECLNNTNFSYAEHKKAVILSKKYYS